MNRRNALVAGVVGLCAALAYLTPPGLYVMMIVNRAWTWVVYHSLGLIGLTIVSYDNRLVGPRYAVSVEGTGNGVILLMVGLCWVICHGGRVYRNAAKLVMWLLLLCYIRWCSTFLFGETNEVLAYLLHRLIWPGAFLIIAIGLVYAAVRPAADVETKASSSSTPAEGEIAHGSGS